MIKCIVMVNFRWCWLDNNGIILLDNIIADIYNYVVLFGNVIAGG